jgi:hypothetical protein
MTVIVVVVVRSKTTTAAGGGDAQWHTGGTDESSWYSTSYSLAGWNQWRCHTGSLNSTSKKLAKADKKERSRLEHDRWWVVSCLAFLQ